MNNYEDSLMPQICELLGIEMYETFYVSDTTEPFPDFECRITPDGFEFRTMREDARWRRAPELFETILYGKYKVLKKD